jgi:hypothetical protein
MNDGHAAVTELLGAWALVACSAEETATVTMGALEFCYLLGNRRDPDSVPHRVEGDAVVAATLLRAATTLGCD